MKHIQLLFYFYLGSHEAHTAYFYKRLNLLRTYDDINFPKVKIPGRKGFIDHVTGSPESDIEVSCDPVFLKAVKSAVGKLTTLISETNQLNESWLSSGRPKRSKYTTYYWIIPTDL